MKLPNFVDPQFLDATAPGGLNPAMNLITASFAAEGSGIWATPGLLAPEAMVTTFSGMTANVSLPLPWGVVTSGGLPVRAHGTQTGQDTQAYTVSFASLVPGTGTVTAYLAATISTILQSPFPVPGPPPGQPAYSPTYVPAVGYAANTYTVALSAVTGGIDNVNTFELFRTTLTAGQATLSNVSPLGQVRAPLRRAWPPLYITSGGTLAPAQAQQMIYPLAGGLPYTLPYASGSVGLAFGFNNSSTGTCTVAVSSGDLIHVLGLMGSSARSNAVIPAGGSIVLWADGSTNAWRMIGGDVDFSPQSLSTNGYRFFPNGLVAMWGVTGLTAYTTGQNQFTIPLPTSFPTFPLWSLANWGGAAPPLSGSISSTPSGSTINVTISTVTGQTGLTFGVTWLAIGY